MACRFPAARVALVALLWARAPAGPSGSPTPESADYVPMPGRADLPFSAMVGPMLYLSGQLGMLADMAEWGAMNQEYVRFFTAHRPARSAFGTTGLALGARIELECTALAGRP